MKCYSLINSLQEMKCYSWVNNIQEIESALIFIPTLLFFLFLIFSCVYNKQTNRKQIYNSNISVTKSDHMLPK